MHLLLLIAIIIIACLVIRYIRQQPKKQQARLILKYGLYALAILIIGLVITGRMHWLTGVIAALFPLLQRLLPFLWRMLPFIKQASSQNQRNQPVADTQEMDINQALKIFGLERVDNEEQIIKRHRELIQKNHPDHGGSDFLAAQINRAKSVLLDSLQNTKK